MDVNKLSIEEARGLKKTATFKRLEDDIEAAITQLNVAWENFHKEFPNPDDESWSWGFKHGEDGIVPTEDHFPFWF